MTAAQLADANYEAMRAARDAANEDYARLVDAYLDAAWRLHCAKLLLHEHIVAMGGVKRSNARLREQLAVAMGKPVEREEIDDVVR